MPTRLIERPLNVATPLTALTVVVPESVPPPGFVPMAIDTGAVLEVTVLPFASWIVAATENAVPAVVFAGCVVNASLFAAPGTTVNVELVPADNVSPLVRVAVRLTPDSAFVYVTPEIVTEFVPEAMVPVRVPPSVPVPVALVSDTPVADETLIGAFEAFCA